MWIVWLLACAGSADDDSAVADACADVPVVTWETFGAGFLRENCQSCHASTQVDREGAPTEVTFDTAADAWVWKDRILARAAAEAPTMPPLAGTTAEDRERLAWWFACAEEGT
jgi:hypothetical protein